MIYYHKLFKKMEEATLLSSFYKATIDLIPKPSKDITRKLQTNILYKYRCTNPHCNTSKLNPATYKKDCTP